MNLVGLLGQFGGLAREAITSNFWGLACPFHCQGTSVPTILASYLLGLFSGILLCIGFWILLISSHPASASHQSSPVPFVRVPTDQLRRRLASYRALYEQSG